MRRYAAQPRGHFGRSLSPAIRVISKVLAEPPLDLTRSQRNIAEGQDRGRHPLPTLQLPLETPQQVFRSRLGQRHDLVEIGSTILGAEVVKGAVVHQQVELAAYVGQLGEVVDQELDVSACLTALALALSIAAGEKSTAVTWKPCCARKIALSPSPQPRSIARPGSSSP